MLVQFSMKSMINVRRLRIGGQNIHRYHQKRFKSSKQSESPKNSNTKEPPPTNQKLLSFGVGSIAGLAGSLAGMGGGFIMIPLMTSPALLSITQHMAHGTSLFAVTTTGLAGGLSYAQEGNVDFYSAGAIAVSGMLTARFGAKFSNKLSQKELKKVLGAFMLFVAPIVPLKPYLMSSNETTPTSTSTSLEDSRVEIVGISACIGLFSGFMAGLLGVGGGAVVVPALTLFTPMDHYTALGTSLTAMGLPALVGTMTHYKAGNVNMRIAPLLALGSLIGAYGGGMIGTNLDEDLMRKGFSGLMLTLGIRTLVKA
jgi:uncharacterized membrane protein YfcA